MTHPDGQQARRVPTWIWAVGVVVALAAAVGITLFVTRDGDTADPVPAAATAPPAVPAATSAAPAAAASATPTASRNLKLGQKFRLGVDGYTVELAALKVKRGDGYEGVQVRVCNRGKEVSVSRTPWTLGYDDFEQLHDIDISGGGLAEPAYEQRDLATDECAKGWVNFTRIEGQKPDGIQYLTEGAEPVRWSF